MNKTVEQLQKEAAEAQRVLEAAQAEQRKAEQKAEEAKNEEVRKQRRIKEAAARLPIIEGLVKAFNSAGIPAEIQQGNPKEFNESVYLPQVKFAASHPWNARIEINEMHRGSGFHSRPTGRLYLTVGEYGHLTKFPQKADGSFSYDKIAKEVAARVKSGIEEAQREQDRKVAQKSAEELTVEVRKLVNKKHEYSISASKWHQGLGRGRHGGGYSIVAEKGKVLFEVGTLHTTPSQAKELSEFLVKLFPGK